LEDVIVEVLDSFIAQFSSFVWGTPLLVLLLGGGIFFTIYSRFTPFRFFRHGINILRGKYDSKNDPGDISHFQALSSALASTVGMGNISGVAIAIHTGGPGAIFWMWITALLGMATKYAEAVLAVKYREVDELGRHVGGPMYYIRNGLGEKWRWLAMAFALLGTLASFGIGNMVQANSVADAVKAMFQIPTWLTGTTMTVLTAIVILGGIQRIAGVAAKLVPVMAIAYVSGALCVVFLHIQQVPEALLLIIKSAFSETPAYGGFAGASVWAAIRFGVARGVFSNEAGLGSAPIAHAAAKTKDPVQQGMIAMLGTLIDTLIICTLTALVIILTGVWDSGENGAALSTLAFNQGLPGWGGYIVVSGMVVFAFTTILGWSYYGERCAEFLWGEKVILPYRILWLCAIPVGAMGKLTMIWLLADVLNGLMAIPNLMALALLSPVVFKVSKDYLGRVKQ